MLTADTTSQEPRQEQYLRFKDPYHPSNYQHGTAPLPAIPEPMALPHLLQQRYALGNRQAPATSSSTAASATNNFDPTKSDATFAPGGPVHGETMDATSVVVGLVRDQQQLKGPQSAFPNASDTPPPTPPPPATVAAAPVPPAPAEEAIVAFPNSWTRGKLIGAGAFGQVIVVPAPACPSPACPWLQYA